MACCALASAAIAVIVALRALLFGRRGNTEALTWRLRTEDDDDPA
jgi:hypothetical protein